MEVLLTLKFLGLTGFLALCSLIEVNFVPKNLKGVENVDCTSALSN